MYSVFPFENKIMLMNWCLSETELLSYMANMLNRAVQVLGEEHEFRLPCMVWEVCIFIKLFRHPLLLYPYGADIFLP